MRDARSDMIMKQEFGRRLDRMMVNKGWSQSELARRAGLPRDSVSTYIRGRVLPTDKSLRKLAKALDCEPTEILSNHVESATEEDHPSIDMKVSPSAPDKAWLRIDALVPVATAVKVIGIINEGAVASGQ